MTLKNLLKRFMTPSEEEETEVIERPLFKRGSMIPGIVYDGHYYITYTNFLMFINYYKFPDEFIEIFKTLMDQANEFIDAGLEPCIVWNVNGRIISVTSAEYLQGQFIQ